MSESRFQDASQIPQANHDVAGSLADHVRQYATNDVREAQVRDQIADHVEEVLGGLPAAPAPVDSAVEDAEETFDVLPHGVSPVLTRDGDFAECNGGLWTVTYQDHRPQQQFGHAYFAATLGPFRRVPQ